jgi:DNA-cytosine methyltransferase
MNVLSCFDGMSCGQIALERAGIRVDNYFASEIDKYAVQTTQKNYPNTIQLGDIRNWKFWNLPKIDLLIAGSPCQGFSFAGDQLNFEDPRSKLFFEYVEILRFLRNKNPDIKFLLENVKMKKEYQDVISEHLGVEPILINSELVSAQSRRRLYWTNIPNIIQPKDKKLLLKDVLETEVDKKYFYSEKAISYLDRAKINKRFAMYSDNEKSVCLTANFTKALPYNVYVDREKSYCITATYMNRACICYNKGQGQIVFHNNSIRRLTPTECEKLQTVPINYTNGVSNSQRYKMLGNGWTVDVVAHIFSFLPKYA